MLRILKAAANPFCNVIEPDGALVTLKHCWKTTEVPFLTCATYYIVGATLSRRSDDALAVVGDLLVTFPSASGNGRHRRIPFEIDHGRHVGGLTHFGLLNHPAVYEQIRTWLGQEAPAELTAA